MTDRIWPEGLNHLAEQGGWAFTPVIDSARSDFDSGPARVRRRFTRSTSEVEMSLAMSFLEIETFKAFVEHTISGASRWFIMPVFQGSIYGQYEARFKDPRNPYKVSYRGYNLAMVTFTIETRQSTVVYSPGTAYLIGIWGQEYTEHFADRFQVLVNELYPAIWQ